MPKSSQIANCLPLCLILIVGVIFAGALAPSSSAAAHRTAASAKDHTEPAVLRDRRRRKATAKSRAKAKVITVADGAAAKKGSVKKNRGRTYASGSTSGGSTSPTAPTSIESPATTVNPVVETPSHPIVTETGEHTESSSAPESAGLEAANLPLLASSFEKGLVGWNTAGVGEVIPTVDTSMAREGTDSLKVALTGEENRSELIFGGNGTSSLAGTFEFHSGDEYWYGFSFYINKMVYGKPGGHNLIMQFKSAGEGSPLFGLQLWNYAGKKGIWSAGTGMEVNHGGERFLSAVSEGAWHDIQIHFRASETGTGFYEIFLDGNLIDSHVDVTNIVPGAGYAYIKEGIYRNGETVSGTSEVHFDAAKLGKTQASVLPN